MFDTGMQDSIADRFGRASPRSWRSFWCGLGLGVAVASAAAAGLWRYAVVMPTDDELAKLAVMASCSTGESAVITWSAAFESASGIAGLDRGRMARDLLLRVDVDRCRVRSTANRY